MATDPEVTSPEDVEDDLKLPEGPPAWAADVQLADPAGMVLGGTYYIDPFSVDPDPDQPRTEFPEGEIRGIALSIWHEQQEETAQVVLNNGQPMLLHGECRQRACRLLKMPLHVRVVQSPFSRGRKIVRQVNSNCNRLPMRELDEARSIQKMIDEGISMQEIRRTFNKQQSWVDGRLKLLRLVPEVQAMMSASLPEGQRLVVSKAMQITDAPKSHQLELAKQSLKMNTTRARMMVREATGREQLASDVDRELNRRRGPADDRRVLDSLLERTANMAADFNGFSTDKLDKLYSGLTPAKRRIARTHITRARNNMEQLCEKLLGLKSLQEEQSE